jgi:hypothetical protein
VGAVSFVEAGDHTELHLAATFDSDTAVVRVRFRGQTYWTTPNMPTVCGAALAPGSDAEAEVVAFDLAGNASAPATIGVTRYVVPEEQATCFEDHHHVRCGNPLIAVVYLAPFIGLIGLALMLVVVAFRASRRRGHADIEPLSIASAVYLARAVRLRAHIALAFVMLCSAGASINDGIAVLAILGSPVLIAIAIGALVRWAQASRFARLLGYDGVTAEIHGDRVTIVVGGKVAVLRATPGLIEKAKRNALPKASL